MVYNSNADSQDIVSTILDKAGGITVNAYPLKRITRNFNAAQKLYYGWAFEADNRWNLDDFNNSSPPIETQNIVSGTNRYKFSSFTSKIMRVIRLECLNSSGKGIFLIPETINNLKVDNNAPESGRIGYTSEDTFQELYVNAESGTPTHYCKYGDFVYLRPNPNYSESGGLIAYFNRLATAMASTDTTDESGIPEIHIELVCELAANMFKYDQKQMSLGDKIAFENYVKSIVFDYIGSRDEDMPSKLTANVENTR